MVLVSSELSGSMQCIIKVSEYTDHVGHLEVFVVFVVGEWGVSGGRCTGSKAPGSTQKARAGQGHCNTSQYNTLNSRRQAGRTIQRYGDKFRLTFNKRTSCFMFGY